MFLGQRLRTDYFGQQTTTTKKTMKTEDSKEALTKGHHALTQQSAPPPPTAARLSPAFKLTFALVALCEASIHMQYVHGKTNATKRATIVQLIVDLIGQSMMKLMVNEYFEDSPKTEKALQRFLTIHLVVHVASLGWAVLSYESLEKHMREFRARELPRLFGALEWLYEQSDTSLYLALTAKLLSELPIGYGMAAIVSCSALFPKFVAFGNQYYLASS